MQESEEIKYVLLSDEERKRIMKDYTDIVEGDKDYKSYSLEKLCSATRGMYLKKSHKYAKEELIEVITDCYSNKEYPIAHEDSMTAWGNQAVEQHGLNIQDILNMKPGERMNIILMDRNVGDYTDTLKPGTKYDPLENGFSYATYIHAQCITGTLIFTDLNITRQNFTWELNALDSEELFWGPISDNYDISKYDPEIKIGWRGPAIKVTDAIKYMPRTITHYGTWYDDYLSFKYTDYLKMK